MMQGNYKFGKSSGMQAIFQNSRSWLFGVGIALVGALVGFASGSEPKLLLLAFLAGSTLLWFFTGFEQCVLALLVFRSSLDIFSAQGLPAVFALGVTALTLMYVIFSLLTKQEIKTDWLFWVFLAWVVLQSMWLILTYLNALPLDATYFEHCLREWIRIFSWSMSYLLIMQLKDRVAPQRIVSILCLSTIVPFGVAAFQSLGGLDRVQGTLGHPNNFSTFSFLFLVVAVCKLTSTGSSYRIAWMIMAALSTFFFLGALSLTGLAMLCTFILVYFLPRLKLSYLVGGTIFFVVVVFLFFGSETGSERLAELQNTPLLNPDMDLSYAKAIQLSDSRDANSFNWRLVQWSFLLQHWQRNPLLGYGLDTASLVSELRISAHNDYIRFLVETGVVGFVSFVGLLFAQIVRLLQVMQSSFASKEQHNLSRAMLALLAGLMVGMFAGNIFNQTAPLFYWWCLLAVLGWDWSLSLKTSHADNFSHLIQEASKS